MPVKRVLLAWTMVVLAGAAVALVLGTTTLRIMEIRSGMGQSDVPPSPPYLVTLYPEWWVPPLGAVVAVATVWSLRWFVQRGQ
jgi:hypothetical protein